MSTTILNFSKTEVTAENREMAIAKVEENHSFHVKGDATPAYKRWKATQVNGVTERSIKEFMLNYLAKKDKNCPGTAYAITLEPAVQDTRERPYKIENVKGDGKRRFKRFYKWVDAETGVTIASTDTNKADATNLIKNLYKDGSFKGTANLVVNKDVVEGTAIVAKATYTPAKNTKQGTWLIFGIEA